MRLVVLLHHEDDQAARRIVDEILRYARTGRLSPLVNITVSRNMDEDVNAWHGAWQLGAGTAKSASFFTQLADLPTVTRLRLVAITTSDSVEIAQQVDRSMESLARATIHAVGGRTMVTEARIAVIPRGHLKPARDFFAPFPTRNFVALPFDRSDDASGAEAITDPENSAFAAHGAIEVSALCGLWLPMESAPMETIQSAAGDGSSLAIRLTQSRIRSVYAPTVSLSELFDETRESLPVPAGFQVAGKLNEREIEDLVAGVLQPQEQHLVYDEGSIDDPSFSRDRLLQLVLRGLSGLLKELPGTVRGIVAGEARTVVRLALERSISPHGGIAVKDDGAPLAPVVAGFDGMRPKFSGRDPIPGEVWTRIVERVFSTVDGDKRGSELRERALGSSLRLPVRKDDLLDGLDVLEGVLPRLALGEERATLLGQARGSRTAGRRFQARPTDEALTQQLEARWPEVVATVGEQDADLIELLADVRPFDWTDDIVTLCHAESMTTRQRRKAEGNTRAGQVDLPAAIRATVGFAPSRILWLEPENKLSWRPPLLAVAADGASEDDVRRGILAGIGHCIELQHRKAARHVQSLRETLDFADEGELSFAVHPLVYVVMAFGFAGIFYEFLTSVIFSPFMRQIPEGVGNGSLYGLGVVLMLFAGLALTNLGMRLGWQRRLVAFGVIAVFVLSLLAAFDLAPRGRSLIAFHLTVAVALLSAWWQTRGIGADIRLRLARGSFVLFVGYLVVVLAVLESRGAGIFSLLSDTQLQVRFGLVIEWTSRAAFTIPFVVLWFLRVQKRIALQDAARRADWALEQIDVAEEAAERLGLAVVQWNVTACAVAQVMRRPYGPMVPTEAVGGTVAPTNTRRAQVAGIKFTKRGSDSLNNALRGELVKPGWLKQQSEIRIRSYQEWRAKQHGVPIVELLEQRPETDELVPTRGEIFEQDAARSRRLEFAVLGDRGHFDRDVSAPIGDRELLRILVPMLRDASLHEIQGNVSQVENAVAFLEQSLPVHPAPKLPLDEVKPFDSFTNRPIDENLEQYVWWPEFIEFSADASIQPVEQTSSRWILETDMEGRGSVQLLAVRVDASKVFDYSQLMNSREDEELEPESLRFSSAPGEGPVG